MVNQSIFQNILEWCIGNNITTKDWINWLVLLLPAVATTVLAVLTYKQNNQITKQTQMLSTLLVNDKNSSKSLLEFEQIIKNEKISIPLAAATALNAAITNTANNIRIVTTKGITDIS